MHMKFIYSFNCCLLTALLLLVAGCNETLYINEIKEEAPEITQIAPTSGPIGSEIVITGSNLLYIQSAKMGDVELTIKYRLSQSQLVAEVTNQCVGGKITLSSSNGAATSSENFTVTYAVPSIQAIPAVASVGGEIEIIGTDMSSITRVTINEVDATITYRTKKELGIKIPLVAKGDATIAFFYQNKEGEQTAPMECEATLEVTKPTPVISSTFPAHVKEGSVITLEGQKLELVDKIKFGEVEATILTKFTNVLTLRVPTLPVTAIVGVTASYFNETESLTLSTACEVFIPLVYHYEGVVMGAHRNGTLDSFMDAKSGKTIGACLLPNNKELQQQVDFALGASSNINLALYGPQGLLSMLRNFWCNGKVLAPTSVGTVEEYAKIGLGDIFSTTTLFTVLQESNENQTRLIAAVRNGSIDEISIAKTAELFDNAKVPFTLSSVRTRTAAENKTSPTLTSASIFEEGSVIAFINEAKNKRGLIWVKNIVLDYSWNATVLNSSGSMTFDIYYQR